MLPLDLAAGLTTGRFPSEATLMSVASLFLGVYLARKLWWGGAAELEKQARLQLVSQRGQAFEPEAEETKIFEENAHLNQLLGAGLLGFGLVLTLFFIGSYFVVVPIAVTPTMLGRAVQIAVMLLFNFLVIGLELFGARVFLKR